MRILLDACVPRPLRSLLPGHTIRTAQEMGWGQFKNGALLQAAEAEFDLLVTSDQNLKYQQHNAGRKLAVLVLPTNDWPTLRGVAESIRTQVGKIVPGDFVEMIA